MSRSPALPPSPEFINLDARVQLRKFLEKVKKMIEDQAILHLNQLAKEELQAITKPQVFISYAWEQEKTLNNNLQTLLKIIKEDLESAGLTVWLDLSQMTGSLDEKMRSGIRRSQHVLLMGTKRYAERTKLESKTNVNTELEFALEEHNTRSKNPKKYPESADFLLPLMLEGDYISTFPRLLNYLIRDVKSWYNLEQNKWKSIDAYIEGLTQFEPVGILPCLLGLSRLNDYPNYRKACIEKYQDYQKLLMLELKLERGKVEKLEFERQKQELQKKQEELTLSLKKSKEKPPLSKKEIEQLFLKLQFAERSEKHCSDDLVQLQNDRSSKADLIKEAEKELKKAKNKSNTLRSQYEAAKSKIESVKKQENDLASIRAQLALQQKELSQRETAVTKSEELLKEHQKSLDQQAAEQVDLGMAIQEQLIEIKKSIETPGKLESVSDVKEEKISETLELKSNSSHQPGTRNSKGTTDLEQRPPENKSNKSTDENKLETLLPGSGVVSDQPQSKRRLRISQVSFIAPKLQKDFDQLMQFVVEGEQDKAEKLIQENESLLLFSGTVKDLSGREFEQIKPFQYALWAVDWHMWTMMLKYLSGPEIIEQLQELERESTEYGKHFTLKWLMDAMQFYVDNAQNWGFDQRAITHWCETVGGEQKLLPAHVVNEYCHPERGFDPCPQEWKSKLPRTRDTELISWFTIIPGGELGRNFGFYRYNSDKCVSHEAPQWPCSSPHFEPPKWPWSGAPVNLRGVTATKGVVADLRALHSLWKQRMQQLESLKSQFLFTSLQFALQTMMIRACKEGKDEQIQNLFYCGALPDMRDAKGEHPLGAAVWTMSPNAVKILLTRVDGTVPMTWAQCEEHNQEYYGSIFMPTQTTTSSEWLDLLKRIKSNAFIKLFYLQKANEYYKQNFNWEGLEKFVQKINQSLDFSPNHLTFCIKTEQEFESLRKQIKQMIEKPQPKVDSKQTQQDSKYESPSQPSKSKSPLPPLSETGTQRFMPPKIYSSQFSPSIIKFLSDIPYKSGINRK